MCRVCKSKPTVKDCDTILAMESVCFMGEKSIKLTETQHWWIAWRDGRPVGYAGLDLYNPGLYWFCRAGVMPEARGLGIHDRLIKARLGWLRRMGQRRAITYTSASNYASANNLIKHGFRLYHANGGYLWWQINLGE